MLTFLFPVLAILLACCTSEQQQHQEDLEFEKMLADEEAQRNPPVPICDNPAPGQYQPPPGQFMCGLSQAQKEQAARDDAARAATRAADLAHAQAEEEQRRKAAEAAEQKAAARRARAAEAADQAMDAAGKDGRCASTLSHFEIDVLESLRYIQQAQVDSLPCSGQHKVLDFLGELAPNRRIEGFDQLLDAAHR